MRPERVEEAIAEATAVFGTMNPAQRRVHRAILDTLRDVLRDHKKEVKTLRRHLHDLTIANDAYRHQAKLDRHEILDMKQEEEGADPVERRAVRWLTGRAPDCVIRWIITRSSRIVAQGNTIAELDQQRYELRHAIEDHRDSKGHDRCWLNDRALYEALGEPIPEPDMPRREKFLEGCRAYFDGQPTPIPDGKNCTRCNGSHVYELENLSRCAVVLCHHEGFLLDA